MSFDVTKYTKSKWIKGADLPKNRPTTVTIKRAYEHYFEQNDETRPALEFEDHDQGLVLNKTQIIALIEAFGQDVQMWAGQRINLLPVPSNYQGKPTILITVAESAPTVNGMAVPPF